MASVLKFPGGGGQDNVEAAAAMRRAKELLAARPELEHLFSLGRILAEWQEYIDGLQKQNPAAADTSTLSALER